MAADGRDVEDTVVFIEQGTNRERALNGLIINETQDSITVQRRDGEFEIARRTITKVIRRTTRKPGIIARAVDSLRAAAEAEIAAAAKVYSNAILALVAARDRNAPPEEIARLVNEVAKAWKAWRALR